MPQRTWTTPRVSLSYLAGSTILAGREWDVQPLMPSPLDLTPQAITYRAANRYKNLPVRCWLGIQYAQHPVGDRRFKAAVPIDPVAGSVDCSTPPPPPYQTYADELGRDGRTDLGRPDVGTYDWIGMGVRESEAVATLNIWAPATPGPHPVVVHIHGGGWCVYHAMGPQQLGHRLAAHKGTVVVTVEYPLSTWGHWPHPDLATDGEPSVAYTFIREAVRWVHANIAGYGGNPDQIEISGSSAGASAVQLLMEDDTALPYFSSALMGSGGGNGVYMGPDAWGGGWIFRTKAHEMAIRGCAPLLTSAHPDYRSVADAIAARGFVWAMQHALRPEHIQALADIGPAVDPGSVREVIAGTGAIRQVWRASPENVYPMRRGGYPTAVAAAKAGKFRKPFIILYAECEALNLFGHDYPSIRDALRELSSSTLDEWSQRLGYSSYSAWLAAPWQPSGPDYPYGLESLSSAQFRREFDPLAAGCEPRRVLYTHAVYGYPAWRIARAAAETGSAPAWLVVNNFSANSIWAGHSMEVALMFGNTEWIVGGVQAFPTAVPPGPYANQRLDGLYASEIMMQMVAALAATGDPGGAYHYAGFEPFAGNPPADGGSLTVAPQPYSLAQPGHANILGKYFNNLDNLNAGTFHSGTGTLDLASQRDARLHYAAYMDAAMLDYLARLEGP